MRVDRALLRLVAVVAPFAVLGASACSFDVDKLFERDDPQVERARRALEASVAGEDADLQVARLDLEEILELRCEADGGHDRVIERPGAALDLGLVLFRIAELVGNRFGDEEVDGGSGEGDELLLAARARELDCAHLFLRKLAADPATPPGIALRARYLLGNFSFLARRYKDAIARYDEVLVRHPARGKDPSDDAGVPLDDDAVARAAAWNRAIALKRLQDQENDAGPDADATPDAAEDAAEDGAPDGDDAESDTGDADDADDSPDAGPDGGDDAGPDGGSDAGADAGASDTSVGDGGERSDTGGTPGDDASAGDTGAGTDAGATPQAPTTPPPATSGSVGVDLRELDRFDKKAPLDLDFKNREKSHKKIPKAFDK